MTRSIAAMQPTFLPYLGYFHLMETVDEFVVLDDVQFTKPSWQMRNRVRTPYYYNKARREDVGWIWLIVPTRYARSGHERELNRIEIDTPSFWNLDHMNTIDHYYKKSAHFDDVFPIFKEILERPWRYLIGLNMSFIIRMRELLDVKTPMTRDSSLPYDREVSKSKRLANLCEAMGADVYVEPEGGKKFLEVDPFENKGIKVYFQKFVPFEYKQLWAGSFVSHLSTLDAMFCLGCEPLRKRMKELEVMRE